VTELAKKGSKHAFSPKDAEKLLSEIEKTTLKRPIILKTLKHVLSTSIKRLNNRYTTNPQRLSWARIAVNTCAAAGNLLRDADLDDLQRRVAVLEQALEVKRDEYRN
jgi:hypothetical protein